MNDQPVEGKLAIEVYKCFVCGDTRPPQDDLCRGCDYPKDLYIPAAEDDDPITGHGVVAHEDAMENLIMRYFDFAHLPAYLQGVSGDVYALACSMNAQLPDGPEKSAGLRKLLEAKDCFVRAVIEVNLRR